MTDVDVNNPSPVAAPGVASFESLFRAYAAELPRWFLRLRVPPCDTGDAAQDVWLEVFEHLDQVPTTPEEARRALFLVAARVAQRFRRRAIDAADREAPIAPEDLAAEQQAADERALAGLALLEALDRLDEATRRMVIASKVFDRSDADIAREWGLSEAAVRKRIWRACVQIQKAVQKRAKRDKSRGALVVPAALVIEPEIKAAMCAIWEAEGRLPSFGGPSGPGGPGGPPCPPPPPPPPRPPLPGLPWLAAAPVGVVLPLLVLIVVVVLVPVGVVLLVLHLWAYDPPELARAGLVLPVPPAVVEVEFDPAATPPAEDDAKALPPKSLRVLRSRSGPPEPAGSSVPLTEEARRRLKAPVLRNGGRE